MAVKPDSNMALFAEFLQWKQSSEAKKNDSEKSATSSTELQDDATTGPSLSECPRRSADDYFSKERKFSEAKKQFRVSKHHIVCSLMFFCSIF